MAFIRICFTIFFLILFSSCSFSPTKSFDKYSFLFSKKCANSYDDNYKGHYKIGPSYIINKKKYHPQLNITYDEIGDASWYGSDFHCNKTANGEIFNKYQLSAAHKTLPLPSVVEVTNLENKKSVRVVVNDRGPFVNDRIIDLSEAAASALGTKQKGIAKVRVKYLHQESQILLAKTNLKKDNNTFYAKKSQKLNNNTPIMLVEKKNYPPPIKKDLNKLDSNYNLEISQNYSIFIGKFHDKKEALKTIKNLSNMGYTKLSQIFHNKIPYYEVSIASSARNPNQAKSLLQKVINLGYKNAYFTNE